MTKRALFFGLLGLSVFGAEPLWATRAYTTSAACAANIVKVNATLLAWAETGQGTDQSILAAFSDSRGSQNFPVLFASLGMNTHSSYVAHQKTTVSILWEMNRDFRQTGTKIGVRWKDQIFWSHLGNAAEPHLGNGLIKPIYEVVYALPSEAETEQAPTTVAEAFAAFSKVVALESPINDTDGRACVLDLLFDTLVPPGALIVWNSQFFPSRTGALVPIELLSSRQGNVVVARNFFSVHSSAPIDDDRSKSVYPALGTEH